MPPLWPLAQQVNHTIQAQVLMPVDVAGMRFVIAHRPAFEATMRVLPLPSAAHYEIASDKRLLAAFMQEHKIPAPTTLLDIRNGLAAKLVGFRFPVLLKPIHRCGGQDIVRYDEPATLLQAVADLPETDQYIIQNCPEGYDIDCNVLYQNGRLVAHSIQKALVASAVTAKFNFPALACLAATGRPVLPGPSALGRYIPFATFLKLRFGRRPNATGPAIAFAWRRRPTFYRAGPHGRARQYGPGPRLRL